MGVGGRGLGVGGWVVGGVGEVGGGGLVGWQGGGAVRVVCDGGGGGGVQAYACMSVCIYIEV